MQTSPDLEEAATPPGIRGLLSIPAFRGIVITNVLAAMTLGSSRFVFVWLIGDITDWDTATAILGILIGLPPLFLSAWAGSLADRLDPNKLGLVLLSMATVLFAATAVLVTSDMMTVPIAMGCAFATAIAPAMLVPLLQALVPSIVPGERLMQAVAIQNMGLMFSMIAGTFVCGAAIQAFGIAAGFWTLAVAAGLAAARYAMADLPARLVGAIDHKRGAIKEGFRRALGTEPLRSLLALTFVMGMATSTQMLLLPELARDVLGKDSLAASALTGFMGIGVLITSMVLATRWTPKHPGLVIVVVMAACLGGGLVLTGASKVYALTALIMFVWGAAGGIVITLLRTLTQLNTPPELMGRVMGLASTSTSGALPVSALLLVVLINTTSISATLMISGVIYTCMVLLIAAFSPIRTLKS